MSSQFQLADLCSKYLRNPASWGVDGQGDPTATFEPPLTAPEQTAFADLQVMSKFGVLASLTLTEFQAIKPDLATAKAFVGIVSPTAAQSNAALKATIRVIGALLRS